MDVAEQSKNVDGDVDDGDDCGVQKKKEEEREDGGGVGEILKKLDSIAPSILSDDRIWLQESKILNY